MPLAMTRKAAGWYRMTVWLCGWLVMTGWAKAVEVQAASIASGSRKEAVFMGVPYLLCRSSILQTEVKSESFKGTPFFLPKRD